MARAVYGANATIIFDGGTKHVEALLRMIYVRADRRDASEAKRLVRMLIGKGISNHPPEAVRDQGRVRHAADPTKGFV